MDEAARGRSLVDPELSPLVDRRGEGFVVSESTRRVVMLDRSRRRLLAESAARGERCILLTGDRTAVTHAYAAASARTGGAWVARSRHGLRDALTGRRLRRVEDVLRAPDPLELADEYRRPPEDETIRLDLACSIRHRNPATAEFGAALEAIAEELLDEPELSWGSAEPALVPWDGHEVSAWLRDRLAAGPALIAAGEDAAGRRIAATLRVQPTRQGSEEILAVAVALGDPGEADAADRLGRVPEALAALAEEGLPLMATAHARYARSDLMQSSTLEMPLVPMALLLGAPAVSRFGLDLDELETRHDLFPIGEPRAPGAVVSFGSDIAPTNFVDLREFILELDREAMLEQFGEEFLAGLIGAGWREAAEQAERERAGATGGGADAGPADEPDEPDELDELDDRTLPPPEDGWPRDDEEEEGAHAS